jgi:hypothetical protein
VTQQLDTTAPSPAERLLTEKMCELLREAAKGERRRGHTSVPQRILRGWQILFNARNHVRNAERHQP